MGRLLAEQGPPLREQKEDKNIVCKGSFKGVNI